MALPLSRYELFHSTDLDEARDMVGRIFVPHRLNLVRAHDQLDARMHTQRINKVSANYVAYGGEVLIEPGELESFYVVQIPLTGTSLIRSGAQEIFSTSSLASVVTPTDELKMRWSADCAALIFRVERAALEAHLRDLTGVSLAEPVSFRLGMNVNGGHGKSWFAGFQLLVSELSRADSSMINSRVMSEEFEDWLMTGLLLAQPHNYSSILDRSSRVTVPSRSVTLARELIESHPEWPHTVTALARSVAVSVRGLQLAFAHHLGTSPKAYLTRVRMQRAHDELRAAQPGSVSVQQVAARWGFGHPGRFAGSYRRCFGELPSQTLAS